MTDVNEIAAHGQQSVESQILGRMRRAGRGSVWCVERLHGIGQRNALDQGLRRLAARGTILRVAHGVYLFPLPHPLTITAPATIAATLTMLTESGVPALVPIGRTAAAVYDLVPAENAHTYGAVATRRSIETAWWQLFVIPVAERFIRDLHPQTATLIQAMRYHGQAAWGEAEQGQIRAVLSPYARQVVAAQAGAAPRWMAPWLVALGND